MMSRSSWLRPPRAPSITLLAALTAFGPLGCSAESDGDEAGGGTGGSAGSAGSGSESGDCRPAGTGTIEIVVTGLPEFHDSQLIVGGPVESVNVTESRTLRVSAGLYALTAGRVTSLGDPIVRSQFAPTLDVAEFCLGTDETQVVNLSYSLVPTSHRLWATASDGAGALFAFDGDNLTESADVEYTAAIRTSAGGDVAFDVEGNVWVTGSTVADPHLMRFPAAAMATSSAQAPDVSITIEGVECVPAIRAFAFDRAGGLWVSTCSGVVGLPAPALRTSGTVAPTVTVGNLTDNGDVAFDTNGNLWVTSGNTLVRYDAARLIESIDTPPDETVRIRDELDSVDIVPSNLAFDEFRNLWVVDFGGNLLTQVGSADLEVSGLRDTISLSTLTLGVTALLDRPAFDELGGLWIALDRNHLGRFSPEQLTNGTGAGDPSVPAIIINSPALGNFARPAFFPAPAGLPLFHSYP